MRLIAALLALFALALSAKADGRAPAAMEMPPYVVLIICKVDFIGVPSDNDLKTGHRETAWHIDGGKMVCHRREVQLYDPIGGQNFNPMVCARTGISMGAQFDASHADKPYRFWRSACPVPTVDLETGRVVGWTMPPCGHQDTVVCENDTTI